MAKDAATRIKEIARERILVLDGAGHDAPGGAPGTEDYRGERFARPSVDVTGDPDVLNLTRPDLVALDPRALFRRRRRHHHHEHLHGHLDRPVRLRARGRGLRDQPSPAPGSPREVAGDRFVAGSVGPLNVTLSLSPKVDDPGFRTHTFDADRELRRADARARRGRRRPAPARDDLRHPEREGGDRRRARGRPELPLWISATIVDRSGRTLSGQTIEAFWTSIEHADPLIVGVNCSLGAQRDAALRRRAGADRALPRQRPPERRPPERLRRLRRDARGHARPARASSPRRAS